MFQLIEKLRQKPERKKKQIAFFTALSVAGIIFVVWLSVIYPDIKSKKDQENMVKKLEPSAAQSFGATILGGFSAVGEQFGKIKETISTFSGSAEYYSSTTTKPTENFETTN